MDPAAPTLESELDRIARLLAEGRFVEVAQALRLRSASILHRWRRRSVETMTELDRASVDEFAGAFATMIDALAGAMECGDSAGVRSLVADPSAIPGARLPRTCSFHTLLAEERLLRSVLVLELREELARPLTPDEAAALHETLDLIGEYSILTLVAQRGDAREKDLQRQVSGMHRLADLGTIVAGVAHDAVNLLLPLRMHLDHLARMDLPAEALAEIDLVQLLVRQFQNSIVNLRWLSVDPTHGPRATASLNLNEWFAEVADFHRRVLPPAVQLVFEPAPGLPAVQISSAALSQAVLNLIGNAQNAIIAAQGRGRILVRACPTAEGGVRLSVEDDGPGMPPEVLARCLEPFFTTRSSGSGLGLALVQALITGSGGKVELHSPPPGQARGTIAVLTLPLARPVQLSLERPLKRPSKA